MPLPDTASLLAELRALIEAARTTAARQVNAITVLTNFEIGRRIVLHEQGGEERAQYGRGVVRELAGALTAEFGKGFSAENLWLMRRFYLTYRDRAQIVQMASTPSLGQIVQTPSTESHPAQIAETPPRRSLATIPFQLSWSHYVFLTRIDDVAERSFYEVEATSNGWSLSELRRQFDTSLYERLALSRDKEGVLALAAEGQIIDKPADMLKDPYVLEFLGLEERPRYSESDLEGRIIDKLEHFLLELGKGFLFGGRQRRFTFDDEHFFVDLVFYNRLLRCFVLLDLKIGKITHQDLGQMQMYVNFYDRHVKLPEEGPTVGIILCKRNREALVEITLPEGANVHAREYRLVLPSKAELRRKLLEWTEDAGETEPPEQGT
ncbi:MAG: PDDEXK nuclease domain-containing protein [Pseudomonadota bacterium]